MSLQYGIKEVLNVSMVDFSTNKPFAYIDYAQVTSNENTGELLELTGGQGNYTLLSFDHSKKSSVKLTLPLVDLKLLAMLAGDSLAVGATDVFKREVLTVDATNKVTLSETPIAGSISVFNHEGERDLGDEITEGTPATTEDTYSIANKDITLNATSHPQGSEVVVFYQYAAPATTKKFTITANKFPKYVKIYGDGLGVDQVTGTEVAMKVVFHKAKPNANFTITMSATEATTLELDFTLFAVKDVNGNLSYVDYIMLT